MPGLTSLQLPNIITKPTQPLEGFVKYFVRNGKLKVLTPEGEYDVVLEKIIDGFSQRIPAPIEATDTVLEALEKLNSGLQTLTLTGDVNGTVQYNAEKKRYEIITVVDGLSQFKGYAVRTLEERNAINDRYWRMIVGVYDNNPSYFNGQYELIYNLENTDIHDNRNWRSLNKGFYIFQNKSEGVIPGSLHQMGQKVIPVAFEEINGLYVKCNVKITLDPIEGTVSWYSNIPIQKLILILT